MQLFEEKKGKRNSVHLAFREVTAGSCSALLKVFRDIG